MARSTATKPDTLRQELTPEQDRAIALLMAGGTDESVAEAVGVGRQTVNRWKNQSPAFVARMNDCREAVRSTALDKFRGLLPLAVDRLADEIANGENGWKIALKLVEVAGFGDLSQKIGPTDPRAIIDGAITEQRNEAFNQALSINGAIDDAARRRFMAEIGESGD